MMRYLDDSNEHEVWNDTDSYRVVLFVVFLRPTVFLSQWSIARFSGDVAAIRSRGTFVS